MHRLTFAAAAFALALPAAAMAAPGEFTYGDVQVVSTGPASNPNVFQVTSDPSGVGYGGIDFRYTQPFTLSQITQLSADYQMTVGTIGGGAPRFSIFDDTFGGAYVYFGTPTGGGGFSDPNAGTFANTGNYADLTSTDLRVEINGFGGINAGNTFTTFADFVAQAGSVNISRIYVDLDAGYSSPGQQMLLDNFTVNNDVFAVADGGAVPEPATWAMMLVGFGGLGAVLRLRRRRGYAFA